MIECYGKAWTSYWGGMGEDRTIATFFCDCNNDYIIGKMLKETHQTDFDKITETLEETACVKAYIDLKELRTKLKREEKDVEKTE